MKAERASKEKILESIQWRTADWLWLAEVAKSVGMSRSAFVRESALLAAKATAAGLTPYFVSGAKAPPQNTAINDFSNQTAQQVGGGKAVMEEPNPISRGADHRAKPRRG
jgi:hypothetical protein